MRRFAIALIRLYQHTLSPDHGWCKIFFPYGYCRFTPSCSQYTIEAIHKHGTLAGSWQGLKRIGRCNPLNPGGYDPA